MIRVAAANFAVTLDRADNLRRAAALISAAAKEGASLVALPECFTGKYGVAQFAKWQEPVVAHSDDDADECGTAMMAAAAKRHGIAVTGGIVERAEKPDGAVDLFNSLPMYGSSGALLTNYRKVHLSRVLGVTSESDVFSAGSTPATAQISDGISVGMACCFDLRFPAFLAAYGPYADGAAETRVDVLCAPSAFLEATGVDHWNLLCQRAALDLQSYVVAPNVAYDATDAVPLHGRALVCDPWGSVLAQTAAEGDDLAIAEVSKARVDEVRSRLNLAREGKVRQNGVYA